MKTKTGQGNPSGVESTILGGESDPLHRIMVVAEERGTGKSSYLNKSPTMKTKTKMKMKTKTKTKTKTNTGKGNPSERGSTISGKQGTGGESDPRHRIMVVAGERGTGKTSLILAAFPRNRKGVPSVVSRTDTTIYGVPITILDTRDLSSSVTRRKLNKAHVIVLTYACDRPDTFGKLTQCWLPYLVKNKLNKVPVVVVGCKQDLPRDMGRDWKDFDLHCRWMIKDFPNVDIFFQCSANTGYQVSPVFSSALRAIAFPIPPLLDPKRAVLSHRLVTALNLIFLFLDQDNDNALSETEIKPLELPDSFDAMKRSIEHFLPGRGIAPSGGITLAGFLTLHHIYVVYLQHEKTWATVRAYGFDDELKYVAIETLQSYLTRDPHQRLELTFGAISFLRHFFSRLNLDEDNVLPAAGVDRLFATELDRQACCKDDLALTSSGGLPKDVFLSMWELMALRDPARTFANLINIGYAGDPNSAICIKEQSDGEELQSEMDVCQCFVFGRKKAGKSALLDYFLGRKLSESYTSTTAERFAVNSLPRKGFSLKGTNMTLVLREIPEDESLKVLSSEESLAACDIAMFVYHSSDEKSWERAKELHAMVADCGVPCRFLAAQRGPEILADSIAVSRSKGLGAPLSIDLKSRRCNDVFLKIVDVAALGRKRKLTLTSDPLETEMDEKSTKIGVENMDVDRKSEIVTLLEAGMGEKSGEKIGVETIDGDRGSSGTSPRCKEQRSGSSKMRFLSENLAKFSLNAPFEIEKSGQNKVECGLPHLCDAHAL